MRLLGDEVLEQVYQDFVRKALFSGVASSARPRLIVVGGQPGAGKTRTVLAARRELAADGAGVGAALINGDELRPYHPHYEALVQADSATAADKTGADVGWWVRRGIAEAIANRFSTVLETTMRQPEAVTRTLAQFIDQGFMAEVRVLLVHPEVSSLGVYQRYATALATGNALPRFTLKHYHDAALAQMPLTLAAAAPLAHAVQIVDRRGGVLYASPTSPQRPTTALEALRKKPLSEDRIQSIGQAWAQLVAALNREGIPTVVREGIRAESQRFNSQYGRGPAAPSAPVHEAAQDVTARPRRPGV